MNTNIILSRIALAFVLTVSTTVYAASPNISGFLDITQTLSDGQAPGVSPIEGKFDAAAELDYESNLGSDASIRLDTDLVSGGLTLEQAFITFKTSNGLSINGGIFNNPVGWEAEDAPDMYQITHTQIYNILALSTAQNAGNNVVGVSVAGDMGDITLIGGILNDLGNVNEENSLMGVGQFKGIENLVLELGIETQELGLETIIDVNGTYTKGPLTIGGEILLPGEIIDLGFGVTANYKFNDKMSGTVHFDTVSYDVPAGADDTTSIIFAGSYSVASNVFLNAEIRLDDNSNLGPVGTIGDGDLITLELIATF